MSEESDEARKKLLSEALDCLRSGIELLDRAQAPGEIAARVEMAANQLMKLLLSTTGRAAGAQEAAGEGFETV